MNVFPRDPRLDHRLNKPCPECAHAMWLHNTDRCSHHTQTVPTRGGYGGKLVGCQCTMRADDFTPRPAHELFGPVRKWGYRL